MKKILSVALIFTWSVLPSLVHAQAYNVFEVDTATIHSTAANDSFDSFDFDYDFENDPALFVLGATTGWNTCEVRMRNVDESGFEAVCAEDSSFDGPHAALNFQYIATAEGVQTIPTNSGGSVTFATVCKDVTQVQHNCTTGCATESWNNFSFGHTFSSAPVVLANIQTVNNGNDPEILPGDGIEPMLSVAVGTIGTTGVDIALDLNKEDNITLSNAERVCVIAVEATSQCDDGTTDNTLDFSALNGPSSVAFESIITGEVVDGWGTATDATNASCNAGEQANFTSGCFSSTPVAVATKRSRNEAEGWLRYCQLNTSRLRVTIDEQRDDPSDNLNRQHVNESISVMAFGQAFTTPVSLAQFYAFKGGKKRLAVQWSTESESFNVGFNVWGSVGGEWLQLNKKLIPAKQGPFSETKEYEVRLHLGDYKVDQLQSVGLSSIDNSGKEEFFGPFELAKEYGESAKFEPIDWQHVREQYEARMRQQGYVSVGKKKWVKRSKLKRTKSKLNRNKNIVQINIVNDGMHRISALELINAAPNLAGSKIDRLALTFNNQAVARQIESNDDVLDESDFLVFYAKPLSDSLALYTSELPYRFMLAPGKVANVTLIDNLEFASEQASDYGLVRDTQGENTTYLVVSDSGDPWYDAQLFTTNGSVSQDYDFELGEIAQDSMAELTVELSGGIALPGDDFDHHVLIYMNDHIVAEASFNGFESKNITAEFSADLLNIGANSARVEVVGDTGKVVDIVYIDELSLTSESRLSVPQVGQLEIIASSAQPYYKLLNGGDNDRVYAVQSNGNFAKLNHALNTDGMIYFGGVSESHLREETRYIILNGTGFHAAESIELVQGGDIANLAKADYLVIAHPSFISDDLERFVTAKTESGYKVKVIDWLSVVNDFGYGLPTPQALKTFLKKAKARRHVKYLLLVGGHSYDYNDHLGNGAISFIPADYETVSKDYRYAPTDNGYADLNNDGLPELAIGRWPVRDQSDLKQIVNKTLQWEENIHEYAHRTLLVADAPDANTGQNFVERIDSLTEVTGLDRASLDVAEVYLERYLAEDRDTPVKDAKADFLSYFQAESAGVGLTIYNGHASSSRWTFRNLFNASDVDDMTNATAPTAIMPLACYTTYYETPTVNSLPHQLLFDVQGGAAIIVGASYLSEDRENGMIGARLLNLKKARNLTWGEALQKIKSTMSPWNDAVTNWTILGDPSLKLYR